ncbi:hypothetical protein KCP70_23955 [Salmonella enterica subsp. enterica]|nr:hypothetical protein KCP70_23955 [Salmonella enterica subsp. enterica]
MVINLNVPEGEMCVFTRSSGCGKTTTLKMIQPADRPAAVIFLHQRREYQRYGYRGNATPAILVCYPADRPVSLI